MNDADLAGGYQRNMFNFQNFGVNRIKLKRNGTYRPSENYTRNLANGQYLKASMTFLHELECDTSVKSVSLTPSEWATDTHYTHLKSPTVLLDQAHRVYDPNLLRDLRACKCHLPRQLTKT